MPTSNSELPDYIERELERLPRYVPRRQLAEIITKLLFPISRRSLEVWPLRWRLVNGYACASTREGVTIAWGKFNSAPSRLAGDRARPGATP